MRHLQPNLKRIYIGKSVCIAPRVDGCEFFGVNIGNNFSVGEWKIENREIAVFVPHRRAKRQLSINQ